MDHFKKSFGLQDIRAAIPYKTIYARGMDYYKEGRVIGIRTETDADGYLVRAEAHVNDEELCEVSARFDRRFGIIEHTCSAPGCQLLGGACKHIAALLLAVHNLDRNEERRPAPAPEVADPRNDVRVLSRLSETCAREVHMILPRISLQPYIEEAGRALTLSFRIGERVSCVVRDIYEFADHMRNGEWASYGKTVRFPHCLDAFSEDSRPLADFLTRAAEEAREFHARFAPYAALPDTRRLTLSPRQLDEFYEITVGQTIPASESVAEAGAVTLSEELPCGFRVTEGRILRLEADADFRLLSGAAKHYVFARDVLCRCAPEVARFAVPVFAELQEAGGLRITGPSAPVFIASVLPRLVACAAVRGAERLTERYPVAALSASVALSYNGTAVFARPRFVYDGAVANALAPAIPGEIRDLVGEGKILGLLYAYGFYSLGDRLVLDREDGLFAFAREGVTTLSELCEVIGEEGFEKLRVEEASPLSLSFASVGGRLSITFEGSRFTMEELLKSVEAYRLGKRFVRIRDGSLIELHEESMRLLSDLNEDAGFTREKDRLLAPMSRTFFLDALVHAHPGVGLRRDAETEAFLRAAEHSDASLLPVPERVHASLRNYQLTGFRWLAGLENAGLGGILADDMGLGKTLQMLTLIASRDAGCSLIVCPASLLYNWKTEAARFAPSLRVRVVSGTPEERRDAIRAHEECDLLITSYDLLRNDAELYREVEFRMCVADEAQYIKNFHTKNAHSIKSIRARSRFALTGTPIENALSDLWSIFEYILPGLLPSYQRFHRSYELPAQKGTVSPVLRETVKPFILRRLKTSVLEELPEKIESVMPAVFGREQQRLYDATLAQTQSEFRRILAESGHAPDTVRFLSLLTRLRQICCHPALCADGYTGESAKLELCMELLRSSVEGGHRVLLFSQFTSMLELLRRRMEEEGFSYLLLTGETKTSERLEMVERFNESDIQVFLISLKAGGTGLNLTGADVVIHYDPWWNFAAQNQATDRAYRIGQQNRVQVFRLIAEHTVEEQILRLQQQKADLSDALIREGGTFLSALTREELVSLLNA